MKKLEFTNKWILVTGASSGLGREMSVILARDYHANVVVAARRREKLESLKNELEAYGVQVKLIVADLSSEEEADRTVRESFEGQELYGAVLNAGVTYFGRQVDLPWSQFESILKTNVIGVVRMTQALVQHFEKSGQEGGVMIVSSMSAFFPVPYQAAYSGSKGFILNFITALSHELTNKRFSLTVYTPAGIATEMTGDEKFSSLKSWLMPVKQAASEAIHAFRCRKYTYIPGRLNRAGSIFMRFLPAKFIGSRMAKVYYEALAKAEKKA